MKTIELYDMSCTYTIYMHHFTMSMFNLVNIAFVNVSSKLQL